MRTTLRCWPTEAFGSAIGRGATGLTEAPASAGAAGALSSCFSPPLQPQPLEQPPPQLSQPQLLQPQHGSQHEQQPQLLWHLNMPHRLSNKQQRFWQQQDEPQLLQPQLCSQQQLFSQQQLGSQQELQQQPRWNMPLRLSNRQQRFWQQQDEPQLLQPQLGSQQQLFSQPQLCSQQQLFSQQQLGSQHPQPPPQWKQLQSLSRMQQRGRSSSSSSYRSNCSVRSSSSSRSSNWAHSNTTSRSSRSWAHSNSRSRCRAFCPTSRSRSLGLSEQCSP